MALLPQFRTNKAQTSNFNYSHRFRTTLPAGVCIPVLTEYGVPGQKFKIDLTASLKTLQTLAPVMGSFAVQFDIIWNNMSNYCPEMRENDWNKGWTHNDYDFPALSLPVPKYSTEALRLENDSANANEIGLWIERIFTYDNGNVRRDFLMPVQTGDRIGWFESLGGSNTTYEYPVISPSSLWAYLDYGSGMSGFGSDDSTTTEDDYRLQALPFLTYWDYIRNYVANPQEDYIPCYGIGQDFDASAQSGSYFSASPNSRVSLTKLDDFYRNWNRRGTGNTNDVLSYWLRYVVGDGTVSGSGYLGGFSAEALYDHFSGLAVRTYFPDYFTSRLNSTRVSEYINEARVQVTDGSFTIDSLRFGNKLSKLLNLSLFSGGRFDDWQRAQWSVKPRHDITIPEIVGSFTMDISFDEIVSLSGSETGSNPDGSGLGAVAGRVDESHKSKTHYFETDSYGCFMIVASIVPRIGYSNNLSRHAIKTNLEDWYIPAFDRLGFQDLFRAEITQLSDVSFTVDQSSAKSVSVYGGLISRNQSPFSEVVGSSPAWLEYMTRTDRIRGQFSEDIGVSPYWTLQPDTVYYSLTLSAGGSVVNKVPTTLKSSLQTAIDYVMSGLSNGTFEAVADSSWNWSSYVDPQAVNAIFPDQSRTAENFYLQIYFDFQTNIEKSKELLPSF